MYMQNNITAAANPAFHIDEPKVDPVVRRAEIDKVIELATAAMTKAQVKKLGGLSLAPARDDDDYAYFAQIRSGPIGKSGLEFRFPLSLRETGKRDLAATAQELAKGVAAVLQCAAKLSAEPVREIASEAIAPATGGISPMRIVAVGITPGESVNQIKMTVDVEMLGDDLTLAIERVSDWTHGGLVTLEEKLTKLAAKHVERRAILAKALVIGDRGWIDGSAIAILDKAGFDRSRAVEMLRLDRQVDFTFGGEDGYDVRGGVYWDDGVIRGYVENGDRGNVFRLEDKVLMIESSRIPATFVAGLSGRHLGEVLETDYIPGNALIVDVEESGDWLYLHLEIGQTSIEQALKP